MPLDASCIRCTSYEINNMLKGGRVEKIYQPEKDEVVLLVKREGKTSRLVVSANGANPRMYITDEVKENPQEPPMFCMLLRKHILSGKITDVTSVDFERIVYIDIESRSELGDMVKKRLVCEIMGKNSNIILVNGEGKIIDGIKHVDLSVSRVRNVFPNLTYQLPPDGDRQNPLSMTREDFYNAVISLGEGKSIDRALTGVLSGVSPLQIREALMSATGKSSAVTGELTDEEKENFALALCEMFEKIKNHHYSPCVVYKKGEAKPVDFAVYPIKQYGEGYSISYFDTICDAMNEFYGARDMEERMRSRSYALSKNISTQLEKLKKKLTLLQNTLKEAEEREKFKIAGDIITANLYCMKQGDKSLTAINFYDENQGEITIALDESKSPSKNAQQYYKKYQKAKTAAVEVKKQLEKACEDIEYLQSVAMEIELAKTPSALLEIREELIGEGFLKDQGKKKKEKKLKISEPEEYFYNGYTIYSGKNNLQNDRLTLKTGRANDLWLHTKNIPGSHVLVKYMGEDFPDDVILTAATVAAVNSKAKNSPKVDVDYCPVSHVKKPSGAKAGMVIYEGYYTVTVKPDAELLEKIKK